MTSLIGEAKNGVPFCDCDAAVGGAGGVCVVAGLSKLHARITVSETIPVMDLSRNFELILIFRSILRLFDDNNTFLFVRVIARYDRDHFFRITEIDRLMWHVGRDE